MQISRYQNAREVLREGLRMVEQRESEDAARLDALRRSVSGGITDFDEGPYSTFESGAELKSHLAVVASKAISWASAELGQCAYANRLTRTFLRYCSGRPKRFGEGKARTYAATVASKCRTRCPSEQRSLPASPRLARCRVTEKRVSGKSNFRLPCSGWVQLHPAVKSVQKI
jgi:antitoxin ParD1/3/4